MTFPGNHHTFALTAVSCWSLAYVFTRILLNDFSPQSLGFLRYLIAAAALVIVAFIRRITLPKIRDLPWFILSGAFGFSVNITAFNIGAVTMTASQSSVIIATAPAITAVLARILMKEKIEKYQAVALLLSFTGVLLIAEVYRGFNINSGALWVLAAAVSLGFYNVIQRKLVGMYISLQITVFSIFTGDAMLAIFAPGAFSELKTVPFSAFLCLMAMGVLSSAVAYLAWTRAFALARNTSSVSNYMCLTPLLTTLAGFLIIQEIPSVSTILGGGLIIAGMLIYNLYGRRTGRRQ